MNKMKILLWIAVLAMSFAPLNALAGADEKNYGVPVHQSPAARAADSSVSNPYSVGDRVRAVVDFPSSSDCVRSGDTGTLVCHDPTDPTLPYLVDWDRACGFPQSQVCGTTATNGWWVGYNEIELLTTGGGGGVDPGEGEGGGGGGTTVGACRFDTSTGILTLRPVEVIGTGGAVLGNYNVDLIQVPQTNPFEPSYQFNLDSSSVVPVD